MKIGIFVYEYFYPLLELTLTMFLRESREKYRRSVNATVSVKSQRQIQS